MASMVAWVVYDADGAPKTGASPTFVDYRDRSSNTRTQPTIIELGGGQYAFLPSDADEAIGVCYLVDNASGNSPRRVSGAVSTSALPFSAWHLEDDSEALWSGAAATVGSYVSYAGARAAPAVVAVRTYLFAVTPSAADLLVGVSLRADSPSGAWPLYLQESLVLVDNSIANSASASTGVGPEALVVEALMAYLRRYLPSKCAALNILRPAILKSALSGPFTVAAGMKLRLSATSQETSPTEVTLPTGSATATEIAAAINAVPVVGLTASADEVGRLILTSTATPIPGAPSVVVVAKDAGNTGGNALFGWAIGGEHFESAALVAPSWRGVVDGRPITAPDMGQGFWVMLGNRTCKPTHPGMRRDTFLVSIATEVWRPFGANAAPHRSREAISSCVRAVRELLLTVDGRYLGRQGAGDVQLADVTEASINGEPIRLSETPGILFDIARLTLTVRVFQRPE